MLAVVAVFAAQMPYADAPLRSLLPVARPDSFASQRPDFAVFDRVTPGVLVSPRPVARPVRGVAAAASTPATVPVAAVVPVHEIPVGSVCGVAAIRGQKLATIPGRLPGCGIQNPVRVSSVSGVALSTPAVLNCSTAKALNNWVQDGVKPIIARLGGGASSLQVIAGYSCRTRNNQPGAKISEHGKGKALDISAINLKDGSSVSVLEDWRKGRKGRLLTRLHRAACGPFGTVLGPDADRFHRDHFHVDTGNGTGGTYCR